MSWEDLVTTQVSDSNVHIQVFLLAQPCDWSSMHHYKLYTAHLSSQWSLQILKESLHWHHHVPKLHHSLSHYESGVIHLGLSRKRGG